MASRGSTKRRATIAHRKKTPRKGRSPLAAHFPGLYLTHKEAAFVLAYCGEANGNGTAAARIAGYGGPKVTRAEWQSTGSMLLDKPKIKQAIARYFERHSASAEEIIKRITDDARLDVSGIIELQVDGAARLKLNAETLAVYGPLIKEIETDPETGRVLRVRLNDSQAARRDLARIRRLFSDDVHVNIFNLQGLSDDEIRQRLTAARQRLAGPQQHGHNGNGASA